MLIFVSFRVPLHNHPSRGYTNGCACGALRKHNAIVISHRPNRETPGKHNASTDAYPKTDAFSHNVIAVIVLFDQLARQVYEA